MAPFCLKYCKAVLHKTYYPPPPAPNENKGMLEQDQYAKKKTLIAEFFSLRNLPVPVMVPAVPMPETKASTWPSVALQISGPVVSK